MLRELNNRNNDGISVTLLWDDNSDQCFIEIEDMRSDSVETFGIDNECAADAFSHPFAYLQNSLGVSTPRNHSVRV